MKQRSRWRFLYQPGDTGMAPLVTGFTMTGTREEVAEHFRANHCCGTCYDEGNPFATRCAAEWDWEELPAVPDQTQFVADEAI